MVEVKEIRIDEIIVSDSNTRKDLTAGTEDAGIDDLAQSIKERGLLNPVMVMKREDGSYELIAGQRRLLACRKLGMKTIPAIIRDKMDSTDATIISLVENVHRADMNPIDKARAFQKIYEKYGDYGKVSKETGVTVQTIKRYLTLLQLAPSLREKVSTSDGFSGVSTLSKVAETFGQSDQEAVMKSIGGFKQQIQLEMIKRSGGDPRKLDELRKKAMEGAFDVHICKGLEECVFLEPHEFDFLKKYREYRKSQSDEPNEEEFEEVIKRLR